jgi:hypothetical protein
MFLLGRSAFWFIVCRVSCYRVYEEQLRWFFERRCPSLGLWNSVLYRVLMSPLVFAGKFNKIEGQVSLIDYKQCNAM